MNSIGKRLKSVLCGVTLWTALTCFPTVMWAQNEVLDSAVQEQFHTAVDSVTVLADSMRLDTLISDSALRILLEKTENSTPETSQPTDKTRWMPDPKRAMWLAIVFPGGGQIYNRKYWKLPIFYGGFLGCYYALSWNNTMYHDYAQAYIDIMDDDDNTKSYEDFLPPSYDVNANLTRLQELFRKKKDYYRRYRDMSMFFMIGVYVLSVIDAYVDAELSSFDISRDLSMKVRPAVVGQHSLAQCQRPLTSGNAYGLSCSLNF